MNSPDAIFCAKGAALALVPARIKPSRAIRSRRLSAAVAPTLIVASVAPASAAALRTRSSPFRGSFTASCSP